MTMLQLQPTRREWPEWERLAAGMNAGYEVLEVSAPPVLGDEGAIRETVSRYLGSGRARSLHGAFIDNNPGSGDPDIRRASDAACRKSCAIAEQLNVPNVVFHSGAFPFLRGDYIAYWSDVCAAYYAELSAATGRRIFIENSMDVDPGPIRLLMDKIRALGAGTDRVAVCLDIGHAHYSRTPLGEWFGALSEDIGYIHLSDNMGLYDDQLVIGAGTVDWEEADRLVGMLPQEPVITLEVGTTEKARESVAFMRSRGLVHLGV